jgi:hypothetical protein
VATTKAELTRGGVLDSTVVAISSKPSEQWGGLVAYLMEALGKWAPDGGSPRFLEDIRTHLVLRLMEGHW